jgi:FkbM family methyltransferase
MLLQSFVQRFAHAPFLPRIVRAGSIYVAKRASRLFTSSVCVDVPELGRIIVDPSDLLGSRVFFFGVWEPSITRYMKDTLPPGGIAVDIGANIGYYTLLMSKAVGPSGKVYAVEPSPTLRRELEENVALNDARNVVVVPYGISDRAERRVFLHDAWNPGESHFGGLSEGGLELRRLQDVIPEDDLSRVCYIKIDVEGMEGAVLSDLYRLLPRLSRNLTIVAELRIGENLREILARYRAAGFEAYRLENQYSIYKYTSPEVRPARPIDSFPDAMIDAALVRRG